jgi:hypothetical protein
MGGRGGSGEGGVKAGGGGGGDMMGRNQTKAKSSLENQLTQRGVSIGEERTRLIEGKITGNPNAMSNQIPTTISLMLRVITKENTLD